MRVARSACRRVIGVEAALNMIVSGEAIKSEMLAMLPGQKLFDKLVDSPEALAAEALAFAQSVADVRPLPLVRNLPCKHPEGDAYFQFARNMVTVGHEQELPAPAKVRGRRGGRDQEEVCRWHGR